MHRAAAERALDREFPRKPDGREVLRAIARLSDEPRGPDRPGSQRGEDVLTWHRGGRLTTLS